VHIAIVVQARMGSSRLPGKIALPLAGAPLLVRMLERVRAARVVASPHGSPAFAGVTSEVVLATTSDPSDDGVRALGAEAGVRTVSGHPTDLVARHLQAAREANADVVVKIPSDCPLVDPDVIDRVIGAYVERAGTIDFVSNLHPATYPDGNDVEVFSTELLALADREAARPLEREHTTPFFWENPERFRLLNVASPSGRDLSMSHRFTIDYPEDYAFIRAVYDELWRTERPIFSLDRILALLESRPDIHAINAKYAGVNWYRNHLDELKTVGANETRQAPAPAERSSGA
jgi:spore coat polysaccharide biosynthesis protein SpsF